MSKSAPKRQNKATTGEAEHSPKPPIATPWELADIAIRLAQLSDSKEPALLGAEKLLLMAEESIAEIRLTLQERELNKSLKASAVEMAEAASRTRQAENSRAMGEQIKAAEERPARAERLKANCPAAPFIQEPPIGKGALSCDEFLRAVTGNSDHTRQDIYVRRYLDDDFERREGKKPKTAELKSIHECRAWIERNKRIMDSCDFWEHACALAPFIPRFSKYYPDREDQRRKSHSIGDDGRFKNAPRKGVGYGKKDTNRN